MTDAATRQKIIDKLYSKYLANGFIMEDEAMACFVAHKVPLQEIDSLTDHLLTIGVIVKYDDGEDDEESVASDSDNQEYDKIFNIILITHPSLNLFIRYVRGISPPQRHESQNLIPQLQSGNKYARIRLIEMYLRQVVKQAVIFSKQYDFPLVNAIQNGLVGLIAAVETYDPTKHNYFSTYAFQLIVKLIRRNQHLSHVYPIPLNEIKSLHNHYLTIGVIINSTDFKNEYIATARKVKTSDGEVEYAFDKSKLDYSGIYEAVLDLEPGLEPFIDYIRNTIPPQNLEAQKLVNQMWNGSKNDRNNARARLIEMYLRTVVKLALHHSQRFGLPFDETLQNGILGLITAVDKFNPDEHEKISTYIPWWIIQSMQRNRWIPNCPAYFPVHVRDTLFSIKEEIEEHKCEHCPTIDGLLCDMLVKSVSENNNLTTKDAVSYINYFYSWQSLEAMIENDNEPHDFGKFNEDFFDYSEVWLNNHIIFDLMESLKPREKEVLLFRYGFTSRGVMTLEEIAKIYNLTRERIRQLEAKALRKLRILIAKRTKKNQAVTRNKKIKSIPK